MAATILIVGVSPVAAPTAPTAPLFEGQTVTVSITAQDVQTQDLVAVTGLRLWVRAPQSTIPIAYDQAQLVAVSPGRWQMDLVLDMPGRWRLLASCDGPRPAAREILVTVAGSGVLSTTPPGALLATPEGEVIATPDARTISARRIDRLREFTSTELAGLRLVGARNAEGGQVAYDTLRADVDVTAADAGATAGADAGTEAGAAAGAAAALPYAQQADAAVMDAQLARDEAIAAAANVDAALTGAALLVDTYADLPATGVNRQLYSVLSQQRNYRWYDARPGLGTPGYVDEGPTLPAVAEQVAGLNGTIIRDADPDGVLLYVGDKTGSRGLELTKDELRTAGFRLVWRADGSAELQRFDGGSVSLVIDEDHLRFAGLKFYELDIPGVSFALLDRHRFIISGLTTDGDDLDPDLPSSEAVGEARLQIVATRGLLAATAVTTSYTLTESRLTVQTGPEPCTDIQVAFAGFVVDTGAGGELPLPNALTAQIAIERLSPVRAWRCSFGGRLDIPIVPGTGLCWTDPAGVSLGAGETFKIQYGQLTAASGQYYPSGRGLAGLSDAYRSPLTTSQIGTAGTWSTASRFANTNVGSAPMIIGRPRRNYPCVLILGDSIASSRDDLGGDGAGHHGYIARGLVGAGAGGTTVPYANLAQSGERISTMLNGGYVHRMAALRYASHVICNLATNDIAAGSDLAALQAAFIAATAEIARWGVSLWWIKCLPRTNASNTTPAAGFGPGGTRDQWNTWLATQVGSRIDGLIDPLPYVESSVTPGLWADNAFTGDGVHPVDAGHVAAAPAVGVAAATFEIAGWAGARA